MNLKLSNIQLFGYSILLLLFFALPLKAQVTIGAQKAPHSYSQLELAGTKGGVRLPMLNTIERDALKLTSDSTEAGGLVIYNTDIDCVEFWSDGKWIDLCSATPASSIVNSITLTSAAGTDAQTVCGGTAITPVTYATTGATGATFVGLPAGVTGNWNAGIVTIGGAPTTSGNYIVVLTGGSGSGMAIGTITAKQVLSAISGANGVTKGATGLTYSVTPVSGVTDYTWTVPANWTITAGVGTNSITVTAGTTDGPAGTITVTANNGNCTGTSTLAVSVGCPVKTTNGDWLTFMCYNLGVEDAVKSLTPNEQANYSGDFSDEYGDLYQWGRAADGHQLRTSESYLSNNISNENTPVSSSNLNGNGQVNSTSAAYRKFIKGMYDWRNPQADTLWNNNGKKTVNDPCPDGWRVPTAHEFQSIANPISGNSWQWVSSKPGYLITSLGSSSPTLFLPTAGFRSGGDSGLYSIGGNGYYWSSTVSGVAVYSLAFSNGVRISNYEYTRTGGFSVRCVVE